MLILNKEKLERNGFITLEEDNGNIIRIVAGKRNEKLDKVIYKALTDVGLTERESDGLAADLVDKVNIIRILEISK